MSTNQLTDMLKFIRWICRAHANNMFISFWSWRRKAKVHARDEGSILENGYEATLSVWKWRYWIISRVGVVETISRVSSLNKELVERRSLKNCSQATLRSKANVLSISRSYFWHFFIFLSHKVGNIVWKRKVKKLYRLF